MTGHTSLPAQAAHCFPARAFTVAVGANLGDPVAAADFVEPGDIYRLAAGHTPLRLMLRPPSEDAGPARVAAGSSIGEPGDELAFLSRLTFMAPDGDRVEVMVLSHGATGEVFALPLSPLAPRVDYTLIDAQADVGRLQVADMVCVSFASGTRVTLPSGEQRRIEAVAPGDLVLTRDHGAQPVRWIGKATLRAKGTLAPVVIAAGLLGNSADLVVSPHHRVFIYQRGPRRIGRTAELLVQAKHLVDDDRVTRREGGFVDYYSLVFDQHEIIYAEGVPAESLMVNDATVSLLPPDLAEEIRARFPGLSQTQHFGTEVGREALDHIAPPRLPTR